MFLWKEKGTMRHMSWDPWVWRWDWLEASLPYNMLVIRLLGDPRKKVGNFVSSAFWKHAPRVYLQDFKVLKCWENWLWLPAPVFLPGSLESCYPNSQQFIKSWLQVPVSWADKETGNGFSVILSLLHYYSSYQGGKLQSLLNYWFWIFFFSFFSLSLLKRTLILLMFQNRNSIYKTHDEYHTIAGYC